MPPFSVVEDLDVIKQALDCFCPAPVPFVVDPLALETAEEAFRHGIVGAVAFAAHAADHAMRFENFPIIGRSVLAAAVRMV